MCLCVFTNYWFILVPDTEWGVGEHNAGHRPYTETPNTIEGWALNDSPARQVPQLS